MSDSQFHIIRGLGLACENGFWSNFSCGAGAEVLSIEGARETIQKKKDFAGGSEGKASACIQEARVRSLGWEDPLEKEMQYSCLDNPMDRGIW